MLADAALAGVTEYWVVGDLVAHGPEPAATLGRLMSLPHARFVRGNTDRYVLTGELPPMLPTVDTAQDVQALVSSAASFAWSRGAVTAAGGYDWLASLPVEQRVTLPDGTRVLLVHAAPGRDDGAGLHVGLSDQELLHDTGLAATGADLVFVGHTHLPLDRTVAGIRVVNLGSVSLPATDERRAMWTLLAADESGFSIQRRFADYDVTAVGAALDRAHHPSAVWLKRKLGIVD